MGRRATEAIESSERSLRPARATEIEKALLSAKAIYEGSPYHKRNPGDFGLTPPALPRKDKTLCDEAQVHEARVARDLLQRAIERGLVSEAFNNLGFPKQLWVVDDDGRVFELMYGGSKTGAYHGYPVRRSDPFFDEVLDAWRDR